MEKSDMNFSKWTVIAVEDDFDHKNLLDIMLKMVGVKDIFLLSNDKEINKFFFQTKHKGISRYTIIFLDVRLHKINGLDILQKLKMDPLWKRAKVFILTCSERLEDRMMAEQLGADDYIVKPLTIEKIRELLV